MSSPSPREALGEPEAVGHRAVPPAHVEVHAEEVERGRDRREVSGLQRVAEPCAAVVEQGLDVRRVAGAEQGIEEPAVRVAVAELGRAPVLVRVTVRRGHLEIERDPDRGRAGPASGRPAPLGRVRAACGATPGPPSEVREAGRVAPGLVADERRDPRLVQGHPLRDAVAQRAEHGRRVIGEALGGLAGGPAAEPRLERLRQVPVVQRHDRRDVALEQLVDQPCVEVEAALVERPATLREDPRPGDAEAIRLEPDLLHQVEVLRPAVVVVAGDVAGVAVLDHARRVAEAVPDRLAAAVLGDGALDLVGGRGGPPQEVSRERHGGRSPRGRRAVRWAHRRYRAWRGSRTVLRLYLREQHAPRARPSRPSLRAACGCPGRGLRRAGRTGRPRRRSDAGGRACHATDRGRGGTREPPNRLLPQATERVTLPNPTVGPPTYSPEPTPDASRRHRPNPRSRTARSR